MFRIHDDSNSRVGSIQSIFQFKPWDQESKMTCLLVRERSRFADETAQRVYTQFGFAGGSLYHVDEWVGFHLIVPTDVVCHFAKTALRNNNGIMHVLPLNKVSDALISHRHTTELATR